MQQLQLLGNQGSAGLEEHTGDIACRPVEAGYKAKLDWVVASREYDRYRRSCRLGCQRCSVATAYDHCAAMLNQISSHSRQSIVLTLRPAIFDRYVLALDVARLIQA